MAKNYTFYTFWEKVWQKTILFILFGKSMAKNYTFYTFWEKYGKKLYFLYFFPKQLVCKLEFKDVMNSSNYKRLFSQKVYKL